MRLYKLHLAVLHAKKMLEPWLRGQAGDLMSGTGSMPHHSRLPKPRAPRRAAL